MKPVLSFLFLLLAAPLYAQNPTTITYPSSTDHNTTVAGAPLIIRYDAIVKKVSDGSTVTTKDCGKPASAPTLTCALPSGLPSNTSLTVTMASVWSGGSVPGPASDPFVANLVAPAAPGKPTVQ